MNCCTWQSSVTPVPFGAPAALAVCAEAVPGNLVLGDQDRRQQQHLAVCFQVPSLWPCCDVFHHRINTASRAIEGQTGRGRRRIVGWLPCVLRDGLRLRLDNREGNHHHQEVKKKGRHCLQRWTQISPHFPISHRVKVVIKVI